MQKSEAVHPSQPLAIDDRIGEAAAAMVDVKICGLSTPEGLRSAARAGARYVGFVFYPPSPRAVSPAQAKALAAQVPPDVVKVGLLVDPGNEELAAILAEADLDLLQLHGEESPARVAEIRQRSGKQVMKTVKITRSEDLEAITPYLKVADRLLFDAKPPKGMKDALPGGNAVAFDWRILSGKSWPLPWMLAGGLTAENVAEAVEISGAEAVDVSSGVEDRPGAKNTEKIQAFIAATRGT